MTGFKEFFQRLPVFPLFAGIGLAFGLLVPTIFEWGEKSAGLFNEPNV